MKSVCVFCGSAPGNKPAYRAAAEQAGRYLAEKKITLVYGGGHVGMMGFLADAALAHGGKVIGIIPQALKDAEIAHPGLAKLHVVGSMHERKALMTELADAFIAMPGSYGTMDELFEALTWQQLGIHQKPIGLLNVEGYFDKLLIHIVHMTEEGFLPATHRDMILVDTKLENLLERLERQKPLPAPKWSGVKP